MSSAEAIALLAGVELLTAVLLVWRGPGHSPQLLLSVQGFAMAGLVLVIAIVEAEAALVAVAVLVAVLKGVALPVLVVRGSRSGASEGGRRVGTVALLLGSAVLVVVGYAVARPLMAVLSGPAVQALPVGISLVLLGFALLATGSRSRSQLVGFLVLDNGIATTAFLSTGGVPLVVELGVSLDVLLVVLVLQVIGTRIDATFGEGDLDQLRELHD